jgi:hypothetical protein
MPRGVVQCMFTTKLARSSNQSFCRRVFPVVHSCCRKFLKHVHNLFTHALWLSSPAGLRLEISCESDKKKMNLIFNYDKKIFLTGKMKRACRCENRNSVLKKIRATQTATIQNRCGERTSSLIACASRVDRIGLCAQFPASPSRGQTLSKL